MALTARIASLDKVTNKDAIIVILKFLYKCADREMGCDNYVRCWLMN